jgi:hypothetical protein
MQKLDIKISFGFLQKCYFVEKVDFNFVYFFRLQNTVILRLSNCCQSSAAATPIAKTRRGSRLQKWLALGSFHQLKKIHITQKCFMLQKFISNIILCAVHLNSVESFCF